MYRNLSEIRRLDGFSLFIFVVYYVPYAGAEALDFNVGENMHRESICRNMTQDLKNSRLSATEIQSSLLSKGFL